MAQIISDELGQSFQIKDKDPSALHDRETLFANVATVEAIATFLQTSLGPTGMDKILTDQDDNIIVTNDGATILKEMGMSANPISQLVQQLSQSQDEEVGDGTTTVVILAAAMLKQAKKLIECGVHPIKVAEGYSVALKLASEHLKEISSPITDLRACMLRAAKTSLESKIASAADLAEICVDAVLSVADMNRRDVDMERIYIQTQCGKSIGDTRLVNGIAIKKEFSHQQMMKNKKGAKIALLSCPFEPPKLKNKNSLLIKTVDEYKALEEYERETFSEMIKRVKDVGAGVVLCQWGFDDEANSMLMESGLMAVRWVGGHELGLIAAHIGGAITARFEYLSESNLGVADISEESLFTDSEKLILIESCSKSSVGCVTVLVCGSSEYVIEEAKRSVWDALCAVRNILTNDSIVYGGGSAELNTSIYLMEQARTRRDLGVEETECIVGFGRALLEIPTILAANSGYDAISYVEKLKEQQVTTKESCLGVDCLETGELNMRTVGVFEALNSKLKQLSMAVELVEMILKISDVVCTGKDSD